MKSESALEPGVLATFRLFIAVQLGMFMVAVVGHTFAPMQPRLEIVALTTLSVAELSLLLVYLYLAPLERRLKASYLPIAIIWATAGPILDPYLELHLAGSSIPQVLTELVLWRQVVLLFTPLIVISWQYGIRQLFAFCALTTLVNLGLLYWTLGLDQMIERSLLGIVLIECIVFFLVGHMILNLMQVQRDQRRRLTRANQRMARYASTLEQLTISRERNRLAREMHDVLAHTLSGVAVELEGARTMLRRDPDRSEALVTHSLDAVREGLTETRRALQELRARPLEDLGLALALRSLADTLSVRDGLHVELDIDPALRDYPVTVQQCFYRIAQEALTNVASHAGARAVHIGLREENHCLGLSIRDDGCGFDPARAAGDGRFGLLGMRERASMIGGELVITSAPGRGTTVSFRLEVTDGEPVADPPVDL